MIGFEVTTTWGGGTVHLQPPWWWGQDLFNWSFIHLYLTKKPPPTISHLWAGEKRKKKRRVCCSALGPVYRRGWTRSRLAKHWGPLNTSEWPQLYPRPSESQQSAENQNNIKTGLVGANFRIYGNTFWFFLFCFFVRRVKFGLFKSFALYQHSRER